MSKTHVETGIFGANHAIVMLTYGDQVVAKNTVKLLTNPPASMKPQYQTDVVYMEGSVSPTIKLLEVLSQYTRESEKIYIDTLNYLCRWKCFMHQTYEHCGLKPLYVSIINNKPTINAYDYVVAICEWCSYPEIIIDKELVEKVQSEIPNYSESWLDKLGMNTRLLNEPYESIHNLVVAAHVKLTKGTCPKKWYAT